MALPSIGIVDIISEEVVMMATPVVNESISALQNLTKSTSHLHLWNQPDHPTKALQLLSAQLVKEVVSVVLEWLFIHFLQLLVVQPEPYFDFNPRISVTRYELIDKFARVAPLVRPLSLHLEVLSQLVIVQHFLNCLANLPSKSMFYPARFGLFLDFWFRLRFRGGRSLSFSLICLCFSWLWCLLFSGLRLSLFSRW